MNQLLSKCFRSSVAVAVLVSATFGGAALAQGQTQTQTSFPNKPVRFVTATPGSPQDLVARILGQKLSETWKQNVVVDNKSGAGALLSIQTASKAPADGYHVLIASSAYAITQQLYPQSGFDPERDFIPIAKLASSPNIIVAAPSLAARDLQDVIARARNGQKLQFGSPGHGTGPSMVLEYLVKVLAKVEMIHVPYRGALAPIAAASSGEVALAATGLAPALSFVKSGKVKALAVTSAKRSSALPDVPTMAEAGFAAFDDEQWVGAWVPAITPPAIVQQLALDLSRAVQEADTKERLANIGYQVPNMKREDFTAFVRQEIVKWTRIVKDTGAKPE